MVERLSIAVVALVLASCEGPSAPDGAEPRPPARAPADESRVWPDAEPGPAIECVYDYPADLEARPIAFDGTIVGVKRGRYDDDAGAVPVELRLGVNEVFSGDLAGVVTMHTWNFMLPRHDVTGVRLLAAAGPTMDLMGCGFTRPYSPQDAGYWRGAFSG